MNLKQLSQMLGLSQTTVSRALNGYPEVSEATRLKVRDAALRHNYRPDARAQGLATGRARAIAHILPVASGHEVLNPVFGEFIAGASEVYREADYDLLLSIVPAETEIETYRTLAARRSVDGVIVHAPRRRDARIAVLHELGLNFVVHGRTDTDGAPYSWVDMDNRDAFARATAHLLELGHRRIALLNGIETMDFAHRRRQGYLDALADAGLDPRPDLTASSEMSESFGFDAAARMLAQDTPPTAFVTASLVVAIGVRRACQDHGLRLARDVSIVTHDDDLVYFRNDGIFTALRSPMREHGRQAARMLLRRIDRPAAPPETLLLTAEFRDGQSTGPLAG